MFLLVGLGDPCLIGQSFADFVPLIPWAENLPGNPRIHPGPGRAAHFRSRGAVLAIPHGVLARDEATIHADAASRNVRKVSDHWF
jgi:hypothetical protein